LECLRRANKGETRGRTTHVGLAHGAPRRRKGRPGSPSRLRNTPDVRVAERERERERERELSHKEREEKHKTQTMQVRFDSLKTKHEHERMRKSNSSFMSFMGKVNCKILPTRGHQWGSLARAHRLTSIPLGSISPVT
jgi:hypothetical protein